MAEGVRAKGTIRSVRVLPSLLVPSCGEDKFVHVPNYWWDMCGSHTVEWIGGLSCTWKIVRGNYHNSIDSVAHSLWQKLSKQTHLLEMCVYIVRKIKRGIIVQKGRTNTGWQSTAPAAISNEAYPQPFINCTLPRDKSIDISVTSLTFANSLSWLIALEKGGEKR